MLELELKLSVEGTFAPSIVPERAGVAGVEELAPVDLRATYWDTPDLRLARSGITLRHRTGEADRAGWTLSCLAVRGTPRAATSSSSRAAAATCPTRPRS
jgi:CYTH domain-containing protein